MYMLDICKVKKPSEVKLYGCKYRQKHNIRTVVILGMMQTSVGQSLLGPRARP